MAKVITDSVSIAANTRNPDVLSGKRNALISNRGEGAAIAIYSTGSAIGLFMETFVGEDSVVERSAVNIQNRVPVVPDDIVVSRVAGLPNDRITMPVENTTGGALTFFYRVEVEDL